MHRTQIHAFNENSDKCTYWHTIHFEQHRCINSQNYCVAVAAAFANSL